jgi:TonB family protein
VEFRYTVGVDGAVRDVVLTLSSRIPTIDAAARDAIAKWRMMPATVNGTSVEYKPAGRFVLSHGTRHWRGGGHYEGQFINNAFDGQGSVTWPGGDKYTGAFWGGLENGRGSFTWANGDTYEGNFRGGSLFGHGVLRLHDGTHLEGEFVPPAIDRSIPMPEVHSPPRMAQLRQQGVVTVRFRVCVDGSIKNARIISTSDFPEFDAEAISQVTGTRMIPGTLNGKPIELDAVRRVQFLMR